MKKKSGLLCGLFLLAVCLFFAGRTAKAEKPETEEPETIYNSPYVTFSPDGEAWTTNAGDTEYCWYEKGTAVFTDIPTSLRALHTGEHYYQMGRKGRIPIGRWEVVHKAGMCTHNSYPGDAAEWHGVRFARDICEGYYNSGWFAYCADCGEAVTGILIYMSKDAAETIDYLEVGDGSPDYFYLCPWSRNLEQGAGFAEHICKGISWNQYRVAYDPNTDEAYGGYMEESVHMYNNASEYEGKPVTPSVRLTPNAYTRIGYEFVGWNTEPDGSGTFYEDQARILNLTDRDIRIHKDGAVVTLYAQWRGSSSRLAIDPNGGSYRGSSAVTTVTGSYGSVYTADRAEVEAPAGHTVSFETNGGERLAPVTGTQHFVEWIKEQPFQGQMTADRYRFCGPDHSVDRIRAEYAPDPVTLPEPVWENHSFGGWYYDAEFTKPAGGGGDTVTPAKDTTLYAQWAELVLRASDNYTANGERGAVDLAWRQPDGLGKTYRLYQSRDERSFHRINTAEDVDSGRTVSVSCGYTGRPGTYTVPYTGFYNLTAEGAQGADYSADGQRALGGRGGRVTARVWLQAGEVITYTVGGRNGYNGGGGGNRYANGGGCTVVSTDQKGVLLIAGGGGGAGARSNGGPGGSSEAVLSGASGYAGQSGSAGGGGGFCGGVAGTYTPEKRGTRLRYLTFDEPTTIYVAYHRENNEIDVGYQFGLPVYLYIAQSRRLMQGEEFVGLTDSGDYVEYNGENWYVEGGRETTVAYYNWYPLFCVPITYSPHYGARGGFGMCWPGFEEGDVNGVFRLYQETEYVERPETITPAYGGSSYVNTAFAGSYDSAVGTRAGDGAFTIQSESIGFVEGASLDGVVASDMAPPDAVALETMRKEALGQSQVKVLWEKPADNGTAYYHVAESYLTGSLTRLCRSNVTRNVLTTGVAGYYVLVDESAQTVVTGANGRYVREEGQTIPLGDRVKYLHVAPVDRAGNLGETTHLRLEAADGDLRWPLHTRKLAVEEGDGVYRSPEGTIYVRSDGETPFALSYQAYMEGWAREDYQINYAVFESSAAGKSCRSILHCESSPVREGRFYLSEEERRLTSSGASLLSAYPHTRASRSEGNRELSVEQDFVLKREADGVQVEILPIAGADCQGETVYSDYGEDKGNGICMIGDATAPTIEGLSVLDGLTLLDRRNGAVELRITAEDALSGVRDFSLEIYNTDNAARRIYRPQADGVLRVDITGDDPIFSGDFTATVRAVDNVGNESSQSAGTTEFDLATEVVRILEPQDPVFQRGESGILTITTWGYAEKVEVEFPEELVGLSPELNRTYVYTDRPSYRHVEELPFMIPLDAPENASYEITVRAYKGDRRMEDHPSLSVIGVQGTVLDDVRTRLR